MASAPQFRAVRGAENAFDVEQDVGRTASDDRIAVTFRAGVRWRLRQRPTTNSQLQPGNYQGAKG
jgi:hypothetical protein